MHALIPCKGTAAGNERQAGPSRAEWDGKHPVGQRAPCTANLHARWTLTAQAHSQGTAAAEDTQPGCKPGAPASRCLQDACMTQAATCIISMRLPFSAMLQMQLTPTRVQNSDPSWCTQGCNTESLSSGGRFANTDPLCGSSQQKQSASQAQQDHSRRLVRANRPERLVPCCTAKPLLHDLLHQFQCQCRGATSISFLDPGSFPVLRQSQPSP